MKNKEIVLLVEYGGLGDHLFFSTLPRLLKEAGLAERVYLSDKCSFRNPQIYELVWRLNPYFDGLSSVQSTKLIKVNSVIDKISNIISAHHGLEDIAYEILPEIYLDKSQLSNYYGFKFIDLNYVSFIGGFTYFDKCYLAVKYRNYCFINPDFLMRIFLKNYIFSKSLFDYADMINSSDKFVCLASGGATLAAALKKRAIVYYGYGQPHVFHHSSNHNIQIGGSGLFRSILSRLYFKRNEFFLKYRKNK